MGLLVSLRALKWRAQTSSTYREGGVYAGHFEMGFGVDGWAWVAVWSSSLDRKGLAVSTRECSGRYPFEDKSGGGDVDSAMERRRVCFCEMGMTPRRARITAHSVTVDAYNSLAPEPPSSRIFPGYANQRLVNGAWRDSTTHRNDDDASLMLCVAWYAGLQYRVSSLDSRTCMGA